MIRTIWLDEDDQTQTGLDMDRVRTIVEEREGMLWLDLEQPTSDELAILKDVFDFHPLAVEDVREDAHYPKFENFGDVLLITIQAPIPVDKAVDPDVVETTKEIDIFLGRNFVVTSHKKISQSITSIMSQPIVNDKSILDQGADMLVQKLVEHIMVNYSRAVDHLLLRAETLEDEVVETNRQEEILFESLELKKTAMKLRRILGYQRDIFWNLSHKQFNVIRKRTQTYFRDIYDHIDQLTNKLDLCRETLTNARDLHLSLMSQRTNDVMRVLAVVSTILLPLTFLTGLFGMNYDLPGKPGSTGLFWGTVTAMIVLAVSMLALFRKKKWL